MKNNQTRLNTNPNWRNYPGYAYGLPQASMVTFEDFPSSLAAAEVSAAFLALIADVVEDVDAPTLTHDGSVAVAAALATATARLQNWVYIPTATEHIASPQNGTAGGTRVQLILPCWSPQAAATAYASCADLWNRLSAGETIEDVKDLRTQLNDTLSPFVAKSVNQYAQVKGIMSLGINLLRMPGQILCLGTGARARLMNSTLTDRTPGIGIDIARNKFHTASMLRMSGLPGTECKLVSNADEAVKAATDFGFPVVVKPVDLDRGAGVAADLRTEVSIREAFSKASALANTIMVEKHIPGFTHRLTIVDGKIISVRQRIPGGVTGDGKSTVAELVDAHQQSERSRRMKRTRGRIPVELDTEALELLKQQNFGVETVLPEGQFQRLRRRDNINAGGSNRDVPPDEVHPDNVEVAFAAARVLRLDIAGIDLISTDIGRSWREVGAGICEVNGRPQLAARRAPELFRSLLSQVVGPEPHVPAELILCADNPAVRAAVAEDVGTRAPNQTISTCEGLWRGGTALTAQFSNGYAAAWAAATRPDVEVMTCVMSVSELFRSGSPLRAWTSVSIRPTGLTDMEQKMIPMVSTFLGTAPKT